MPCFCLATDRLIATHHTSYLHDNRSKLLVTFHFSESLRFVGLYHMLNSIAAAAAAAAAVAHTWWLNRAGNGRWASDVRGFNGSEMVSGGARRVQVVEEDLVLDRMRQEEGLGRLVEKGRSGSGSGSSRKPNKLGGRPAANTGTPYRMYERMKHGSVLCEMVVQGDKIKRTSSICDLCLWNQRN
jgi:hypothetical protein